jgi:hypothetical protein
MRSCRERVWVTVKNEDDYVMLKHFPTRNMKPVVNSLKAHIMKLPGTWL